jgi:hypothetical protein
MAQYVLLPRIEGPVWLEPKDITTIQALISEAQEQLNTLKNRTNKDWADNSELMSLKNLKVIEIASLQNILAPIRWMPPEILSEMFMAYCSMDTDHRHWGTCSRIALTSDNSFQQPHCLMTTPFHTDNLSSNPSGPPKQ